MQLFDEWLLDDLNVTFIKIDTFKDYSNEIEFAPPIFNFYNDIQAYGIIHIMKSMTDR